MEFLTWLQSTSYGAWVRESASIWAYPTILTAHTIGLGMLVGANVVLDLTLLGFFPGTPIAPLKKLFPIMWAGFWINTLSGVSLFVADAVVKGTQTIFYVKMLCIGLGVVTMFLIRKSVFGDRPPPGPRAGVMNARFLATASLVCWVGAIAAGRLMAYIK